MLKLFNDNSMNIFSEIVNKYSDKNIIVVSDPPFNIKYKYKNCVTPGQYNAENIRNM